MLVNFYTLIFKTPISYKKSLKFFIISFIILINTVALINYVVDPFWMFKTSNILNQKQLDFDERQQKTNYLVFNNNDYDSLILGSSRTTYMDQRLFEFYKNFNYAANSMYPHEYEYFIETFSTITKKMPQNIILGVDFFGSNKNENKNNKNLLYYKNTQSDFYRIKMLYSFKMLRFSFKNIRQVIKIKKLYYNRDLTKFNEKVNSSELPNKIKDTLKHLENYIYDETLLNIFTGLKNKYGSEFIVYTTPVTFEQIKLYHELGLDQYYFKWLEDLISSFGGIYHFMLPSTLTKEPSNFFDATHATKDSMDIISKVLSSNKKSDGDSYLYLTKNNFDDFKKKYLNEFNTEEKNEK